MPRASLVLAGVAGLAVIGVGLWAWKRGVAGAASDIGTAVVGAAGGAVSGTVGAIGSGVGVPTPDETTTDPKVARWIIDNYGYFRASLWAGVPALLSAATLAPGSGTPPPAGTALARAFPYSQVPQASYDETDRLLNRYPAPATVDWSLASWGLSP